MLKIAKIILSTHHYIFPPPFFGFDQCEFLSSPSACFARSSAPSVRVAKNFFLHRQKISKKSGKYGCCGPFFILLHTMSPFWHIYMGRHLERYQFSFLAFVRKSPEQTAPKEVCRLIIKCLSGNFGLHKAVALGKFFPSQSLKIEIKYIDLNWVLILISGPSEITAHILADM